MRYQITPTHRPQPLAWQSTVDTSAIVIGPDGKQNGSLHARVHLDVDDGAAGHVRVGQHVTFDGQQLVS